VTANRCLGGKGRSVEGGALRPPRGRAAGGPEGHDPAVVGGLPAGQVPAATGGPAGLSLRGGQGAPGPPPPAGPAGHAHLPEGATRPPFRTWQSPPRGRGQDAGSGRASNAQSGHGPNGRAPPLPTGYDALAKLALRGGQHVLAHAAPVATAGVLGRIILRPPHRHCRPCTLLPPSPLLAHWQGARPFTITCPAEHTGWPGCPAQICMQLRQGCPHLAHWPRLGTPPGRPLRPSDPRPVRATRRASLAAVAHAGPGRSAAIAWRAHACLAGPTAPERGLLPAAPRDGAGVLQAPPDFGRPPGAGPPGRHRATPRAVPHQAMP
jgi:hypothetical protein